MVKIKKYRGLAKEIMYMEKMNAIFVPCVVKQDGFTTNFNMKYRRIIDISYKLHNFIQNMCINKTYEMMMNKNIMIYINVNNN